MIGGLGISKQRASQLVDTLVLRGYLTREVNAEDRRRTTISASAVADQPPARRSQAGTFAPSTGHKVPRLQHPAAHIATTAPDRQAPGAANSQVARAPPAEVAQAPLPPAAARPKYQPAQAATAGSVVVKVERSTPSTVSVTSGSAPSRIRAAR